jgi:hypothetical protein
MLQVGLTKTADRVTTERANFVIQQLSGASVDDENDDNDNDNDIHKDAWQKAERARAILEAMEGFEELIRNNNNNNNNTNYTNNNIQKKYAVPLPVPTHETYWNVLRLYGNHDLQGRPEAPRLAAAIVRRMEASGKLELQPTAPHWNQVLAAWANSHDPERSLEAAKLLYELHDDEKRRRRGPIGGVVDGSSFSHTLRACVPSSSSPSPSPSEEKDALKFRRLAFAVALRVWKALLGGGGGGGGDSHQDPTSLVRLQTYHVVHMLRVCKHTISNNDDGDDDGKKKKNDLVRQVMDAAIQAKAVNDHVLNALFQVANESLLRDYLGSGYSKNPRRAIKRVPKEWLDQQQRQQQHDDGDDDDGSNSSDHHTTKHK